MYIYNVMYYAYINVSVLYARLANIDMNRIYVEYNDVYALD